MDKSTYEIRLAQWAEIVKEATNRPEGVLLKEWLRDNGISKDKYYYWQRRVRADAYNKLQLPAVSDTCDISFAEVKLPSAKIPAVSNAASVMKSVATISINGITIDITNDICPEHLALLIREVSHA